MFLDSDYPLKLLKNTHNYAFPQKFQFNCSRWGSVTVIFYISPGDANVQRGLRTTALIPQ